MIISTFSNGARLKSVSFLLCVCVCVGVTPQLISGDVFIDIDDEEPLVPDQVKKCSLPC